MAEVVGLVASIIALVQLSAKVTSLSYTYITGVKRAPEELKRLSNELNTLTTVLNTLQVHSQENSESIALKLLEEPLQQCLTELKKLQSSLEPIKSRVGRALARLKSPFGPREVLEYISQIERFKTLFTLALVAGQETRSKAIAENVQRIEANGQSKKHNDILNWLYPDEFDTRHREVSSRRRKNTGDWLLKAPAVQDLIKNKEQNSRLLWGYGIPGAGKTFLSSLVIDHLLVQAKDSGYGVAYIYFNFKEQEQQKPEHVLASLLKQLVSQTSSENLPKGLEDAYEKKEKPKVEQLYTILIVVAKLFRQTFIVCDALDECQQGTQRNVLLPLFHRMGEDGIGLFLTSREHPEDIQHSFKDTKKLRLSAQDQDIATYIEQKIEESPRAKRLVSQANCKDRIISDLKTCANGMFLLVHFHIEYLCQQTTVKQILAELERLKSSSNEKNPMDPTYNRAMEILRAQPKSCVELAFKVFSWLVKGRRVLTVRELQLAVSVPLESGNFTFDELDLPDKNTLLDVCASLVTIDEETDTVRLVHYTAQEYIVENQIICPDKAHFELAITCTHFLSYDIFIQDTCTQDCRHYCRCRRYRLQLYPFLGYAANELPFHLGKTSEAITAEPIFKFLSNPRNILSYLDARDSFWHPKKSTALHAAAILGNSDVIQRVLKEIVIDINSADEKGQTPLAEAANQGQERIVRLLLENGADVAVGDEMGYTPLHKAACKGHEQVVRLLLEKGPDISATNNGGDTPLHLAAYGGNEQVVRLLLEKGADISATDNEGKTPIYEAVRGGHEQVVQLLLEKGADISAVDNYGKTPLHKAAFGGYEQVVRLLLEKGADISAADNMGKTPLHQAASGENEQVVRLLLEKGADISATDNEGKTPLHKAAYGENERVVRLLLEKGADILAADNEGKTPLHQAAFGGNVQVVRLLLEKGADISAADNYGKTSLHKATCWRNEQVVRLLLEKGADISAADNEGKTPLHQAVYRGYEQVVRLLLEKGADATAVDNDGELPLFYAYKERIRHLLTTAMGMPTTPLDSDYSFETE